MEIGNQGKGATKREFLEGNGIAFVTWIGFWTLSAMVGYYFLQRLIILGHVTTMIVSLIIVLVLASLLTFLEPKNNGKCRNEKSDNTRYHYKGKIIRFGYNIGKKAGNHTNIGKYNSRYTKYSLLSHAHLP